MSEITVEEVHVLTRSLERDIQERIASFENITGCAVTSVYVSRVNVDEMDSSPCGSILAAIEIKTSI